MKKTLLILIVLTIAGLIGRQIYQKISSRGQMPNRQIRNLAVAVEIRPVSERMIRDVGLFTGTLSPRAQFIVAPKIAGRLERILVNIGDIVKHKELIALLDDDEYIQQVDQARAELEVAKANLEEAIEGVGKAAFGFGGQKCSACSRALVEKSIVSDFIDGLKDWTEKLVVGDPRDRETFLGPLINNAALQKFRRSVVAAKKSGKVVSGGHVLRSEELNGYYVEPTIVTGLKADHPLMVNELFVPFVGILPVASLKRAIEIANSSEYGLTSGIMSRDETEVEYFMDHIGAGTIYANRRSGASTAAVVNSQPFVGWKMSGTTGKAAGGRYYLPQFMKEQSQTRCI